MMDSGLLPIFKEILRHDNREEQRHTLTCIWSLCFEDKVKFENIQSYLVLIVNLFQIRDVLKKDKDFIGVLNIFSENTPSDELRKLCSGIFYTINEFPKKSKCLG